jgi:hypothetical protein
MSKQGQRKFFSDLFVVRPNLYLFSSPQLRRASVSRRASISRRPSTSASHSLPSTPQSDRVPPPTPTYQPPLRNLELPSSLKLPLPVRRGAPAPPTPPLRSTYPTVFHRAPSPVLCISPMKEIVAAEPSHRPRPTSLPAALSAQQAALPPRKVRFKEEKRSLSVHESKSILSLFCRFYYFYAPTPSFSQSSRFPRLPRFSRFSQEKIN